MRRTRVQVLIAAALLLAPMAARAHGIQTDIELLGAAAQASSPVVSGRIALHSAFSSGEPARDATVRLITASSAVPLVLGHTDAQGRLAVALPAGTARDAEIQVDAGAGHRDWIELSEVRPGRPLGASLLPTVRGTLLSLAPLAGLGLLGGLVAAGLRRFRA